LSGQNHGEEGTLDEVIVNSVVVVAGYQLLAD